MSQANKSVKGMDWLTFGLSGGVVLLFVIAALINMDAVSSFVNASFAFSTKWFGAFWQVLLFLTFVIAVGLALSKYGSVRLGKGETQFSTFKWVSMIMCTLLAGGGVFFSAAEPMYHFLTPPPAYQGVEAASQAAVAPAMAYSYLHWGYLAWAILGTLSTVAIMYAVNEKGMPLKPRTMLYPILGEKCVSSHWGTIADAVSIIAVAAGTIGPIGFLGLQMSYALNAMFGIPDVYSTQLIIIVVVTALYTLTAISGLEKGIQLLSKFNVQLTIILGACVLLLGPGGFIIDSFLSGFGLYTTDFVRISLFRGDTEWLGWWTVFYWGWFIGYAPLMAIFVARISQGRTIRELVIAVGVMAPIVTNLWFSVLGGTGIFYELKNPGSISDALNSSGLPAALLAIVGQMPLSSILIPAFLVLIVCFLATTGNGMTYTIAMVVTGDETPSTFARVFWGIMMGAVAAVLMKIGGVSALQSWIIFTAVPVSLLLIPMLWAGPQAAVEMYKKQNQELNSSLMDAVPKSEQV